MNPQFKGLLDLICGFADFSGFIVIFAVSRALAEAGLAGAKVSWMKPVFKSCRSTSGLPNDH